VNWFTRYVFGYHLSKWLALAMIALWKGVLWSPSYFTASRGGAPINTLKTYVEQQKTPL
jgi:REP element-mobilizing transposase RayT